MEVLPGLSVVVPLYRSAGVLPRTIPAMMAQEHAAQWVFVDDGSDDDTTDALRSLLASHPPVAVGATTQIVEHDRNRGRAATRNTGRAHAHGEVIVFLDADMAPGPDFLRTHAIVHTDPAVVGAVSPERWGDLDPADPYHEYLRRYRRGPERWAGGPVPARHFIIGYTSVRRSALDEVGGFDEAIPYGEDTDLAMRLSDRFPGGLRLAAGARVVQYGAPTLDQALTKWRQFGRASVPLLLARHPALARDLGGDLARADSLRGVVASILLRRGLARAVRRLLPATPRTVRPLAVRYLVAEAVVGGYRTTLDKPADGPDA